MLLSAHAAPDIVAVIAGQYVASRATPQREFEGRVRMAGGVYILARSLEDLEKALPA